MKKIALLILSSLVLTAGEFEASKNIIKKADTSIQSIQNTIDKEDSKKDSILEEFSSLSVKLENLKNENKALGEVVSMDEEKLNKLDAQIKNIDKTKNAIAPLMENMVNALERLIKADAPFLLEKRLKRVQNLKEMLQKPDLQNSQKFAKIIAAYEIEYGYSNTISTYEEKANEITNNILRIGRVGLYKESLDKKTYSIWNAKRSSWQEVSSMRAKVNIAKGIKIASKHKNAELLTLPFLSSKDIK